MSDIKLLGFIFVMVCFVAFIAAFIAHPQTVFLVMLAGMLLITTSFMLYMLWVIIRTFIKADK